MNAKTLCLLLALTPVLAAGIEPVDRKAKMTYTEASASQELEKADAIFQARDYEKALEAYTDVVEIARKEFNRSVETEALSQVARMNLILNGPEAGREWLDKAAERADDADPMGWSRYLGVKGRFEWKADNLKAARATFDDMYTYCNTNGLWGRAVDAAHMIAIVATNPKEQITWSYRGIEAAESAGEEHWLGPLWNNMAITYYDQKNYDSALTCFLKAREYHWRHSGEIGKLFADYHVGMTYRQLGNYDEAASWLRPVLAWAERLNHHSAIGQACEDLGEVMVAQGKKSDGLQLLKRAREEYKTARFDEQLPEIWKKLNDRIAELES
ncbi:tetratricopeptide repeat protein [candidate division GN15 bacterium]|nr:tetratricopeptide repeat protein [candidate division GN15 bacterium]